MTWRLIVAGLSVAALAVKVARDQRAYAASVRDQRVRFEDYVDVLAKEREHAR